MESFSGILFLMLVGLTACKTKEDPKPEPHSTFHECQVSDFVKYSANGCKDSISILGSWGKISEMRSFNNCIGPGGPGLIVVRSKSYTYGGDKIYVFDSLTNDKETLTLQPGTMRILEINRDGRTAFGTDYFEYGPNGNLRRSFNNDLVFPSDTTWYYYANGDMAMSVFVSGRRKDTTHFSYYLDKKLPENGLQTQIFQKYGNAYVIKNEHLLKSYAYPLDPTQILYEYETDAYGNVTKVIHSENGSTVDSNVYNYRCIVE